VLAGLTAWSPFLTLDRAAAHRPSAITSGPGERQEDRVIGALAIGIPFIWRRTRSSGLSA